MTGIDGVLAACTRLADMWRSQLWPIVHLKRVAQSAWFNPASELTDWVPVARPRPGELVFEHPLASSYSSEHFASYLREIGHSKIFVAGFSLEDAVLATAVESFHRGLPLRVVCEAVACRQPEDCDLAIYRQIVLRLISNYATLQPLEDLPQSGVSLQWSSP